MLQTRFTELLGLINPIMSAPMSNHSGGQLAAAVSGAGGLGTFGGSNDFGPDWLRRQIALIRSQTDRPLRRGLHHPAYRGRPGQLRDRPGGAGAGNSFLLH